MQHTGYKMLLSVSHTLHEINRPLVPAGIQPNSYIREQTIDRPCRPRAGGAMISRLTDKSWAPPGQAQAGAESLALLAFVANQLFLPPAQGRR